MVNYTDQANRLNECLSRQLGQLQRYVKSNKGQADAKKTRVPLARPPAPLLTECIQELRTLQYTDKATKITEPAMGPFEKPVSLAVFPDYNQYVKHPMDLLTVERKAKASVYGTPEDFEFDVNLIFRNCETYNARRNGDHLVAMAKYAARQFRRLFYAKMKTYPYEDPASAAVPSSTKAESNEAVSVPSAPSSSATTGSSPPNKKIKLERAAPRISITAAQVTSAVMSLGKLPALSRWWR